MDGTNRTLTSKYVAQLMAKTVRTIQRYCDQYDIPKTKEGYMLSVDDVKEMVQFYYPKGDYKVKGKDNVALKEFLNTEGVLHQTRRESALKASKEVRQQTTVNDKRTATNDSIDDAIERVTVYANRQGLVPKFYTEEEYAQLIGQLERLEVVEENTAELKEQIAYLRESNKELTLMLKEGLISVQKALTTLSERNTIEANDKGLIR
jgi:hypothetical protein